METKKAAGITVSLKKRNFYGKVEYGSPGDLLASVNEILDILRGNTVIPDYVIDTSVVITLPECEGGKSYRWNTALARSCFDHGRIGRDECAHMLFTDECRLNPIN